MRAWFDRLFPVTTLNYVLLDLAVAFGVADVFLYVVAPPSPATRAALGDTLYYLFGPRTWGLILLGACIVAIVLAGMPDRWVQLGFVVLIPSILAWGAALVLSAIASHTGWPEASKVYVVAWLLFTLVSNAARWMYLYRRLERGDGPC